MGRQTCLLPLLVIMALCAFSEQNTPQLMRLHRHRRMKLVTPAFANDTLASDGSKPENGGGNEDEGEDEKKQALVNWKKEVRDFSAAFTKVMTHTLLLAGGPGHPFGIVTTIVLYATGKMGQGENKDIWSQVQDRVKIEV